MSLFDIFGDHVTTNVVKNVTRLPIHNSENLGKTVSVRPLKPNEPVKPLKKAVEKKSFLSNVGKALQNTPARKVLTPKAVNVGPLIYTDDDNEDKAINAHHEFKFTEPKYVIDNYTYDGLDFFTDPNDLRMSWDISPPDTPPPTLVDHHMEFNCSYSDEFYTDEFSIHSFADDEDLNLPSIY